MLFGIVFRILRLLLFRCPLGFINDIHKLITEAVMMTELLPKHIKHVKKTKKMT